MTIRCAICDREAGSDASNPWRPFCSERCQLLDLSRWLGGDYVIPGDTGATAHPDGELPVDGGRPAPLDERS